MLRRTVTDPYGRRWTLGRHWLPRRRRIKKAELDVPDLPEIGDDLGALAAIAVAIVGGIVVILLALLLFNVVALAIELALVVLIALAGLVGRVVFRRPWIVFARSGATRLEYPVVGYLDSRRRLDELAGALSSGAQLPPGHR